MAIPLTARAPIPFTPPSLTRRTNDANALRIQNGEEPKPMPEIIVRVPTMYERDSFASAMVRGGVVHYSRNQIRDLMLAGVTHLYPEDRFDEIRTDLQDLWAAGDAMTEATNRRTDRYVELMEKQAALPPGKRMKDAEIEAELQQIQPDVQVSESARVKITAIQQHITSLYPPLQEAFANLAEQDVRRAWLCVEIYVINWKGLEHTPEGNGRGGVTRDEAEWLRGQIGGEAFDELGNFIFAMHSIDGDEEKNLASLIESSSALTGSPATPESMSAPVNENGTSTDAPSTSTPADGSPKTTASSSDSTTPAKRKTARSKRTQTDAR